MKENAFEQRLNGLFSQDLSVGTEGFRDALLKRCLAVLDDSGKMVELDDETLELLSAAGDVSFLGTGPGPLDRGV